MVVPPIMSHHRWFSPGVIIMLTIATFFAALAIQKFSDPPPAGFLDPDGWGVRGFRIAAGQGLTDSDGNASAFRGPVIPLVFAMLALIFGSSYDVLLLNQCLFFAVANGLLGIICWRVFGDWRVTLLSMLIYIAYTPAHPWFSSIFVEPIFTAVLAVFMLSWTVALQRHTGTWYFLSGLLLALAALSRPVMYFFLVPFLFLMVRHTGWTRKAGWVACMALLGFLSLEIPWVVRNYISTGRPVAMTSGGTQALFLATWYQEANYFGNPFHDPKRFLPGVENFWDLPQDEQNRRFGQMARENIQNEPLRVLMLIPKRFMLFLFQMQGRGWIPTSKSMFLGGLLYLLALLGYYVSSFEKRKLYEPCLYLILFNIMFHSLLIAEFRYSHPIQPYIFMAASVAIVFCYDRVRGITTRFIHSPRRTRKMEVHHEG